MFDRIDIASLIKCLTVDSIVDEDPKFVHCNLGPGHSYVLEENYLGGLDKLNGE